jgi:hypothetical protein
MPSFDEETLGAFLPGLPKYKPPVRNSFLPGLNRGIALARAESNLIAPAKTAYSQSSLNTVLNQPTAIIAPTGAQSAAQRAQRAQAATTYIDAQGNVISSL